MTDSSDRPIDAAEGMANAQRNDYEVDVAFAGAEDFLQAVIEDPSLLERIPQGDEPPHVVFVGEGVPPVDLARYAGKAVYVHRIRPEALERLRAMRRAAAAD